MYILLYMQIFILYIGYDNLIQFFLLKMSVCAPVLHLTLIINSVTI